MKKLIFLILILSLMASWKLLHAQGELTLDQCYIAAKKNLPLSSNYSLIDKKETRQIEILNSKYLPEMKIFGKAQYQSDVTEIDFDIPIPGFNPEFPQIPNDQYQLGLSIDQIIWDGGIISASKEMQRIRSEIEKQSIALDQYAQRQVINDLFFGALETDARLVSLKFALEDLTSKKDKLQAMYESGVVLRSDVKNLMAEELKLKRNIDELQAMRNSLLAMLSELTGLDINAETKLNIPEITDIREELPKRPEYELFKLNKRNVLSAKDISDTEIMPKFSAFGQTFLARPGLNMFDDEFTGNWIVGIRASWKFWNWNSSLKQKEVYDLNAEMIEAQERNFSMNISARSAKISEEIKKYEMMLERDVKIFSLKEDILKDTEVRLNNGVITSTEYLIEFNDLNRTKIDIEIDKLKKLRSEIDLITNQGK